MNSPNTVDLHMPAISLAEMRSQAPAFDAVPYAEALRRACVALRGESGGLSVVLGDPLDLDTQDWLEHRLEAPFRYRIAEKGEVDGLPRPAGGAVQGPGRAFHPAKGKKRSTATPRKSPSRARPRPTARWSSWSPRRCTTR